MKENDIMYEYEIKCHVVIHIDKLFLHKRQIKNKYEKVINQI